MLNYLTIGTVIANYHGSRTSLGYLASVDATHAVVVPASVVPFAKPPITSLMPAQKTMRCARVRSP